MKHFFRSIFQLWTKSNLMLRILGGIILGTILALLVPNIAGISMLGTLFVGALKSIAPILVAVLVASSISRANQGLGSRFRVVIALYLVSTLMAAILSVLAIRIFPVDVLLRGAVSETQTAPGQLTDIFHNIIQNLMTNPLSAIINANYLSILLWAIVIGLALKSLASPSTLNALYEWSQALSRVVQWIIECAPFGILGIVYTTVSTGGLDIFVTYGELLLVLVGCMLVVVLILNPLLVSFLLHSNPYPLLFRCLRESAISAFFTRSSAANIPVNMALCKRLGLDENFYSVSIPLGSTINMNGAAVTITVMTLATCHTLGIEVSLISALVLSVLATLGACGASGVAGGSLLLIPMACSLFGISNDVAMQVVAVGFIVGVVQDSMETAINSSGDVFFTAVAELYERRKKK
ncbi:MAG: serine/threonine transporter SstT [Paludibacteraceae bacterium]|jgi:serine/threonine transporter|nr:serine/threonine transporter SstT [Paludibacteraceae bacterium]